MAEYVIGDLQGCYDPFRRLLDKIAFDPARDHLWLVGDLVNRGPKSRKTLKFVKGLASAATTVLGNHDLHLLALAHDVKFKKQHFNSLYKILGREDCDDLLHWLRHRPLAHYNAELNTLLVHAGLPPQWSVKKALACAAEVETALRSDACDEFLDNIYGNKPDKWSGKLEGYDRLRFIVNAMTRMRMIDSEGRIEFGHTGPPDKAAAGLTPWFDNPNARWRGTRIVFGHWSALGLVVRDDLIAVDTGCVWGRQLTAVKLTKKPKVTSIQCPG